MHESNKILDGKLTDIKRQYKTNTFEVGIKTSANDKFKEVISQKFDATPTNFRSLDDALKLNIKLSNNQTPNDLLSYLTTQGEVSHFVELVPSANDIFIQAVKNN